jgi:hypothetical protein
MTRRELIELWLRQSEVEAAAGAPAPVPTGVLIPAQRSRASALDDLLV